MGAVDFTHASYGKTPEEAFKTAQEEARYDHGHAGYTGTIAEKNSFEIMTVPEDETINDFIDKTLDDNDKWGSAFCVKSRDVKDKYIFYGFASF